jgi:hypothetical protein
MKVGLQDLANVPEAQDLATLQAQMQRPARNVSMDGGFELGWGTMVLCSGLVPYFNAALPKSVWTSAWTAWIGYLPLICMGFAPYAVPRMIKRFITWPRTGYVANPNDVTLLQLVMLMIFGLALGFSITLPFRLVADIREFTNQHGDIRSIILHGIQVFVCAGLSVYLGRKVIKKPRPLPAAYDAALINEGLRQTAAGRKGLRLVKFNLLLIFIGFPILVGGFVFWLWYLSESVMRHTEIQWTQMGALSFLVATNAILYLMGNGIAIKQHWWKWLALAIMLIGPIVVASAIPSAAIQPELTPILKLFPPPVMLFLGLVWFLSGATTLLLFIRHNPLPSAETA